MMIEYSSQARGRLEELAYDYRRPKPLREETWKAILPGWMYDKAVEAYDEAWVASLFRPVDSWSD